MWFNEKESLGLGKMFGGMFAAFLKFVFGPTKIVWVTYLLNALLVLGIILAIMGLIQLICGLIEGNKKER